MLDMSVGSAARPNTLCESVLGGIVMGIIGVAGLIKFVDLVEFAQAVHELRVVPRAMTPVITLATPSVEVCIGGSWFLNLIDRRVCILAAGTLLTVFSGVLMLALFAAEVPRCGCLGLLGRYYEWANSAWTGLIRNGVMLAAVLAVARSQWRCRS